MKFDIRKAIRRVVEAGGERPKFLYLHALDFPEMPVSFAADCLDESLDVRITPWVQPGQVLLVAEPILEP